MCIKDTEVKTTFRFLFYFKSLMLISQRGNIKILFVEIEVQSNEKYYY